jgi:hypothetical protein
MRKIQILGLALVAVFAFGAIAATSALAGPEWDMKGTEKVTGLVLSETEGVLNLTKFSAANGNTVLNVVTCEGILDGTLGPPNAAGNGVDEVTKVLSLNKEEVSTTPLSGLALGCEVSQAEGAFDCRLHSLAAVWPENLPWLTELELMTVGGATLVLDKLFKDATDSNTEPPAYDVECETGVGTFASELCEGNSSGDVSNDATTVPPSVLGEFSEAVGVETPRANCPGGTGNSSGINLGSGHLWVTPAGDLVRVETGVAD